MTRKHFWNFLILCLFISIGITDASKKSEAQLARAKEIAARAYALLGKPCDYPTYKKIMPNFWEDLFSDLQTPNEMKVFQLVYWNVSVEWKDGEKMKIIRGLETPSSMNEIEYTVYRTTQEAFERSICSAPGGLMECTKAGQCDCLNKNMIASLNDTSTVMTMRGDPTTGEPNPKGTQCFVKEGRRCLGKFVTQMSRQQNLEFTCVYYARCRDDVRLCDTKREDGSDATQASLNCTIFLLVSFVYLLLGHTV